jgi:hypothetical protein
MRRFWGFFEGHPAQLPYNHTFYWTLKTYMQSSMEYEFDKKITTTKFGHALVASKLPSEALVFLWDDAVRY